MTDETDRQDGGVERSKGLTQDDNDGSGPCDLCNTPSPVYTSRFPVRDDGVVARLCGACESGLEDYFSDTESTDVDRGDGPRTDGGTPAEGVEHHEHPHDDYPCPCEGCDNWSIHPDEYCARCIAKGCADGPGVSCNV